MDNVIESLTGKTSERKKSRLPARLDYIQSATGLFLGLFMWAHMFFVSTILVSKDFMYTVTKMFEGSFIIEGGSPLIVTIAVAVVFAIFIIHAGLAMRKFPINYKQYMMMKTHNNMINHDDTKLWFIQAYTGFAMFFLGSVHLYTLMSRAEDIGPYASSDRVVSDWMWPLYILLLLAVELHGSIGMYRLCVKWGWFDGKNPKETRAKLKKAKWAVTVFFLTLGFLSLAAYIKIGIEHMDNYGEKYKPTSAVEYKINKNEVLS